MVTVPTWLGAAEIAQAVSTGKMRATEVLDWQRRFGMPVLPISTAEETLPQLRRLMGLAPS